MDQDSNEYYSSSDSSHLRTSEESNHELIQNENDTLKDSIQEIAQAYNQYHSRLDTKYNIYHEILMKIFNKEKYNNISAIIPFYKYAHEIKKKILKKKNNSHFTNISLHTLAAGNLIEVNAIDIIIFQICFKKKIVFHNIFKHLRHLSVNNEEYTEIIIEYNEEKKEIKSFGEFIYEYSNIVTKKIKKKIEEILYQEKILPFFYIGKKPEYKEILRLKNSYIKKKTSENIRTRIPEKTIELKKIENIPLEMHVDIDGVWGIFKPKELSAINAPLILNFKVRDTAYSPISKSSYVIIDGVPVKLCSVLNFKIGTFQPDPSFPIHLYVVTKYMTRDSSERKISVLCHEIIENIQKIIKKIKAYDSYTKYILSSESRDFYIKNNNFPRSEVIAEKRPTQNYMQEVIPDFLLQSFTDMILKDKSLEKIIKAFYIESFGNKRWSASRNMTTLLYKFEKIIDTERLNFLRIDFALSVAKTNIQFENQKRSLYIKTNFCDDISIRRNSLFSSKKIENKNSKLWFIQKGKIVYDINSIDKINIYSCMIPELFSRKLRSSKACQLTSKIIFDLMCKAQKSASSLVDTHLVKDLRKTMHSLESNDLMDHSFRIEFTTTMFGGPIKIQEAYNSVCDGEVFEYDTGPLYEHLLTMCRLIFNFIDFETITPSSLLKLMIYEILFIEVYIKGTTNFQFLGNNHTRDYIKRLINKTAIPLHNPIVVADDIISLHKQTCLKTLFLDAIKYSVLIPKKKINDVYEFIMIIFEQDLQKIKNTIIELFNDQVAGIHESKIGIESNEISATQFISSLLSMERFIFFPTSSKLYKNLAYLNKFRSDIKNALRHRLVDAAASNQFLGPLDKRKGSSILQKFRIVKEEVINSNITQGIVGDTTSLEKTISERSYAMKQRIIWSEYDTHRLHAALCFYQNRQAKHIAQAILQDLRFGFWAAVSTTQIYERIKTLRKAQKKIDQQSEVLSHLGNTYTSYDPENIALSTIIQIYTYRYGVEFNPSMKQQLYDKYILYVNRESELTSMLYTHESQLIYKKFYIHSPEQMSVLGVRATDLHRIAYDMLSVVRRRKQPIPSLKNNRQPQEITKTNTLPMLSGIEKHDFAVSNDELNNCNLSDEYAFNENNIEFETNDVHDVMSIDNDFNKETKINMENGKPCSRNPQNKNMQLKLRASKNVAFIENSNSNHDHAHPNLSTEYKDERDFKQEDKNYCISLIRKKFGSRAFTIAQLRSAYNSKARPSKEKLYFILMNCTTLKKIKCVKLNPETFSGIFKLNARTGCNRL